MEGLHDLDRRRRIREQRGEFDPRPGLHRQTSQPADCRAIDQPFSAVYTRALLDALMQNHIQTPDDLQLGQPAKSSHVRKAGFSLLIDKYTEST